MASKRLIEQAATEYTKAAVDSGQLLEAGWQAFKHLVLIPGHDAAQMDAIRLAFMAGAEHTFSSIMNMLDPGDEPTAADERRMELVAREALAWRDKIALRVNPTKGNA